MHSCGSGMCGEGRRTTLGKLVFRPRTGQNAPVSSIGVIIVKFAHDIARVLKWMKIWAERGTTFGAGITAPFVTSLHAVGSGAPTLLCQGSCGCGVVAASSIPQGVCSLQNGCSHSVGASSYCFSYGWWKADQKALKEKGHCQVILLEGDVVWAFPWEHWF